MRPGDVVRAWERFVAEIEAGLRRLIEAARRVFMVRDSDVVILGGSYEEARYWKIQFERRIPELLIAQEVSALLSSPGALWGLRVRRLYIAPGADLVGGFWPVYDSLLRNLSPAGREEAVVWLAEEREAA